MAIRAIYQGTIRAGRALLDRLGLAIMPSRDYYSPLPSLATLRRTRRRWDRPSRLGGVRVDLPAMKARLTDLVGRHGDELAELPSFAEAKARGFGPGYTEVDGQILYLLLRDEAPRRFLEVGSGLSTYFASLALERNARDGHPAAIQCIDPFASDRVERLATSVRRSEVQDVALEVFAELEAGDVLFIDSTHVVRIDGDVPYLVLEVLPTLRPGVRVHIHDLHLPYHTPFPADAYLFRPKWPRFWTEGMLVQAFLAFNDSFEIELSTPLVRHEEEAFLAATLPGYRPVAAESFDTHFGSLWLRRTEAATTTH